MDKYLKRISNLNIASIIGLVIYAAYLLKIINDLYSEPASQIMAYIMVPVSTLVIILLFFSAINAIKKGIYDRYVQKWGAILYIIFIAVNDVLIIHSFTNFHPAGKLMFVLVNILALVHIRRYMFRRVQ